MSRKQLYLVILLCVLLPLVDACVHKEAAPEPKQTQKSSPHTFVQKGSVREMSIQPEEMEFPEGPGKAEFTSYCGICHSLKYISAQPDFPRETWEAEVHKMVEKYGAPIDSVNGQKIVGYLVSVKGEPLPTSPKGRR